MASERSHKDAVARLFTHEALLRLAIDVYDSINGRKIHKFTRYLSKMEAYKMGELFDQVYEFTAKWEGGKCDHPADKGGPTAYGVSQVFLTDFCRRHPEFADAQSVQMPVTRASVLALDRKQAKQILRYEFWHKSKVCELAPVAAAFTFDACVNFGVRSGIRLIQQAANSAINAKLTVDGIIGPKTIMAFNADNPTVIAKACQLRRLRYLNLGTGSQKVFLKGWLNRAKDQKRFLDQLLKSNQPAN